MDLITVDIANFRKKLSDYLTLVNLGKAVVSVRNAKNGKEVGRLISPFEGKEIIDRRTSELLKLAGFAAGYSSVARKKLAKMEKAYIKKLKKGLVE